MARRAPHSTVAITGVFFAFGLIMGNLAARFPDTVWWLTFLTFSPDLTDSS